MQIFYNSYDINYKNPFGAVPAESEVIFRIKVSAESKDIKKVILRCWNQDTEMLYQMKKDSSLDENFYKTAVKMPKTPSLFWYYFIIEVGGQTFYYSNNSLYGGIGSISEAPTNNSYQVTVYDKNFETPAWFYDTIMYQIFPDRFFGGITEKTPKRYAEYHFHEDWYEPLLNIPHPHEDGPALCDFFGGSFLGIAEKIPYLKELGISVIYLNPIFEAYSNHRYDTGDYKKTDPILGSEEDFKLLIKKAHENNIRIILDGVFSHTGCDSVYFDKYSNYKNPDGAFHNPNSPYRKWYQWENGNEYKSWWGCSNLPNVNEMNPSYLDYILTSDDSVIKKWLKAGADGWRLDVADELPDEFIEILRKEVKSVKPDALIIGEVWEDASHKVSYGKQREYLLGNELDSVMNYPFKDLFIGFLCGTISAENFSAGVMSIMENYPKCVLYSLMNIVSTHDTMRIKTVLGEPYIPDNLTFEQKQSFKLPAKEETLAVKRMRLIAFLQMTFVGVPCIYYGDEIGMQSLGDPFCRMPYTWRCIDPELLEFYKKLTFLRNSHAALRTGTFKIIFATDGVFIYEREIKNSKDVFLREFKDESIICLLNRDKESKNIDSEILNGAVYISALNGKEYNCLENKCTKLPPYFADILIKRNNYQS